MIRTITHIAIAACAFGATAQTEATDSYPADTVTNELQEIVIEAPKVIRKADMDVYHPSKSAIDNSKDGLQLLNNLMIPTLSVNDALGTIQAAGQSVQIRINGRESSITKSAHFCQRPSSELNGSTIQDCATEARPMC